LQVVAENTKKSILPELYENLIQRIQTIQEKNEQKDKPNEQKDNSNEQKENTLMEK